jgi:O-antigen/teichoic acid export membrane protein
MSTTQLSYRNIIKATSLFGGVQAYQIFISLFRSKIIAVFLGTVGIGISGLLTSTLSIVNAIAGLGLNYTAIREIAEAFHEGNQAKVSRIYEIFSRWLYFSSLFGVVVIIAFSSLLSQYSFGNKNFTWSFVWLSITLFFNVLNVRNNIFLQGTRKLKEMAKGSVLGSTFGLITSYPLYFWLGVNGIVPAMILASISSFCISYYFVCKDKLESVKISIKETIAEGSDMVKFGLLMTISSLVGTIVSFIVNVFINKTGSLSDVGLYSSAMSISSQCAGLVFSAMVVDYFPRLASMSSDEDKVNEIVNHQNEITLLVVLPVLVALIITTPLVVKILLTPEFNKIITFVRIIAVGTIFQAAGYIIGYISLAKGDKLIYFSFNAIGGNVLGLIFFITGYYLNGLNGLALAIIIHHILFFIIFIIITKKLYNYNMSFKFIYIIIVSVIITSLTFAVVHNYDNLIGYIIGIILFLISTVFSLHEINKMVDLRSIFKNLLMKFLKIKSKSMLK